MVSSCHIYIYILRVSNLESSEEFGPLWHRFFRVSSQSSSPKEQQAPWMSIYSSEVWGREFCSTFLDHQQLW